jgi:hypothetical protein
VVERLRHSLDAVADAIQGARLADLVSAESDLAAALAAVCGVVAVPEAEKAALVPELRAARAALGRCRSLGAAIAYVADATMAAHGRHDEYDRAGLTAPAVCPPARMDVRA